MRRSYREWRRNNATPGLFEAEYTSSTPVCTEKARTISMTIKGLIFGLCVSVAASSAALAQQDNYTVRLVAGAAGYDHIQPFLAEHLKLWDKYGVKVEFMGGNYQRSNQMMSIGDFDVGYNQRSEEHTSELQSPDHLVCRLLLEKKKKRKHDIVS